MEAIPAGAIASPVYVGAVLFEQLIEIRDEEPHAAALNMALDEVLLAGARDPMLRIYRWERPSVSFGYFGSHALASIAWPGREVVRRMTGGGVVPHGSDLTYSLIVPAGHPFSERSPRDVYRVVHEVIAAGIEAEGEAAALAAPPDREGSGLCFESPAEFDVLARGRKVAGAALRRTRNGLLLQGSIQELPGLELLRPRLGAVFSAQITSRNLSPDELANAAALAREKYATDRWNLRV